MKAVTAFDPELAARLLASARRNIADVRALTERLDLVSESEQLGDQLEAAGAEIEQLRTVADCNATIVRELRVVLAVGPDDPIGSAALNLVTERDALRAELAAVRLDHAASTMALTRAAETMRRALLAIYPAWSGLDRGYGGATIAARQIVCEVKAAVRADPAATAVLGAVAREIASGGR